MHITREVLTLALYEPRVTMKKQLRQIKHGFLVVADKNCGIKGQHQEIRKK